MRTETTLSATLAERLGLESAADADRRDAEEYLTIDRRLHLLRGGAAEETPVERALRRSGMSACPVLLRGLLPEPRLGAYCSMHWWVGRGTQAPKRCERAPVGHSLVLAPAVRAMQSGRERCGGDHVDWRAPCLSW